MSPSQVLCVTGPFLYDELRCPRFRMRSNLIFEERRLLGRIITHKVTVKSVKNYNTIDLNFFELLDSFENNFQDENIYLIWELF